MRISSLASMVRDEYSGSAAKDYVAQLSRFHRIQASPGFRQAAEWCQGELERVGVRAEVLSFPADEATSWWSAKSFQEWDCTSATLHLTEPQGEAQKLCDYRECKVSLVERSSAFDGEVEVVVLEDGEEGEEYERIEAAGKVVLTRGDVARVHYLAVQERGAVGILSDGMRPIPPVREWGDLSDERQYTRFWWGPHDRRCFGFTLTPRQGQRLRRLSREGKRIRVRAQVEAQLYDGSLEVVSALIPGRSKAEVLLVSHLCHPQPSANDNASGAGALMETARTLQELIAAGKLPQPRRSIRLLWVPEMTGTYAYLSSHEADIAHMVAGLNLDMVGEQQPACGCSFLVEFPPQAMASFAGPLLARLREEFLEEGRAWGGTGGYALFRHALTAFSGGSDHYILADPTVGVPTPMLIQWPDRFWHTTADTLDKVDPHMLHVVGSLATAYACWLSSAREPEVAWLGLEMAARFRADLGREAQRRAEQILTHPDEESGIRAALQWPARAQYLLERQRARLTTLLRLWPEAGSLVEELEERAESAEEAESARLQGLVQERTKGMPKVEDIAPFASEEKAASMVVRRCYPGPLSVHSHLHKLSQGDREALWRLQQERGAFIRTPLNLALYWCDGERTLLEVADLVEQECGQRNMEALRGYVELLEKMELIEIQG